MSAVGVRARAATLAVGEIQGAHGVTGALWVKPLSHDAERYRQLGDVVLVSGPETREARVTTARAADGRWLVTLQDVTTREAAEALRGWTIAVPASQAAPLPAGVFLVHELLGREVIAEDGESLGRITNIFPTGSNDVYEIAGPRGDLLFPALKELVLECRREGGPIRVRLLPGLLEACLHKRA
jgi:16S rRNA processing protein RimM